MKKIIFCLVFLVVGCEKVDEIKLRSEFDQNQAKEMMAEGRNTIKGNIIWTKKGGQIITCAGFEAVLIPATEYAKERFSVIYGEGDPYFLNFSTPYKYKKKLTPDYPEYKLLQKSVKCDTFGNFVFNDVADGEFFVQVDIHWKIGHNYQGGLITKKVSVSNGATEEILLNVN